MLWSMTIGVTIWVSSTSSLPRWVTLGLNGLQCPVLLTSLNLVKLTLSPHEYSNVLLVFIWWWWEGAVGSDTTHLGFLQVVTSQCLFCDNVLLTPTNLHIHHLIPSGGRRSKTPEKGVSLNKLSLLRIEDAAKGSFQSKLVQYKVQ